MRDLITHLPLLEKHPFFGSGSPLLGSMLGSAGRSRVTSTSYDWHGLKRGRAEFALLQYTVAGRGALYVEGREREVHPGTAMLLTFPADNRYWFPADSEEWEFIYLCLYGHEVMRVWNRVVKALGPLPDLAPDSEVIQSSVRLVEYGMAGHTPNPYEASAHVYALLMTLLNTASRNHKRPADDPHAQALEQARRFGEANFAAAIGVEELAREARLSRFHFTRLFTQHTGASPAAWLTDLRVREAARLLRETDLPVKEIATRCGFTDASYLGKVFRQRTGQPPHSYRRSGV